MLKEVFIIGPDHPEDPILPILSLYGDDEINTQRRPNAFDAIKLYTQNIASREDVLIIGDGEKSITTEELKQKLEGRIDGNTHITLNAHGIAKTDHRISLSRDRLDYTRDILKELDLLTAYPINIVLISCYAGAANKDVSVLKKGSTLVTFSAADSTSSIRNSFFYLTYKEAMIDKKQISPAQIFLDNMKYMNNVVTFNECTGINEPFKYTLRPFSGRPIQNFQTSKDFLEYKQTEFMNQYMKAPTTPVLLRFPETITEKEANEVIMYHFSSLVSKKGSLHYLSDFISDINNRDFMLNYHKFILDKNYYEKSIKIGVNARGSSGKFPLDTAETLDDIRFFLRLGAVSSDEFFKRAFRNLLLGNSELWDVLTNEVPSSRLRKIIPKIFNSQEFVNLKFLKDSKVLNSLCKGSQIIDKESYSSVDFSYPITEYARKDKEYFKMILDAKVDISKILDNDGYPSLQEHALLDTEYLKILLDKGVHFNVKDYYFVPAKSLEMMLKHGTDPDAKNIDGRSLLTYYLLTKRLTDSVYSTKILLEYGADPNVQDPKCKEIIKNSPELTKIFAEAKTRNLDKFISNTPNTEHKIKKLTQMFKDGQVDSKYMDKIINLALRESDISKPLLSALLNANIPMSKLQYMNAKTILAEDKDNIIDTAYTIRIQDMLEFEENKRLEQEVYKIHHPKLAPESQPSFASKVRPVEKITTFQAGHDTLQLAPLALRFFYKTESEKRWRNWGKKNLPKAQKGEKEVAYASDTIRNKFKKISNLATQKSIDTLSEIQKLRREINIAYVYKDTKANRDKRQKQEYLKAKYNEYIEISSALGDLERRFEDRETISEKAYEFMKDKLLEAEDSINNVDEVVKKDFKKAKKESWKEWGSKKILEIGQILKASNKKLQQKGSSGPSIGK